MPKKTPNKYLLILIILAVAFLLGKSIVSKQKTSAPTQNSDSENKPIERNKLKINDFTINVEIADTDKVRGLGLSGRETLPPDDGMLFVFDRPAFYSFWMKDMKFPLDFIWIKGDKIVDISENIPAPTNEKLEDLPTYTSKNAVDKVLELNAGKVSEIKAKIGDKITLIMN